MTIDDNAGYKPIFGRSAGAAPEGGEKPPVTPVMAA